MRLVKKEISLGQIRKRKRKSFQETQKKQQHMATILLYYEIYMVVAGEWHSMAKCEILSNFSGQTSFL